MDLDRVYRELDWFSEHKVEFIFCCDANFGMLQEITKLQKKQLRIKKIWLPSCIICPKY